MAARLADRMSKWQLNYQGIAVISFTNAAWQEIERQVTKHFKIEKPIPYPHFLGTIDSFVNRYIFLPFGHLVMGCRNRPVLVGEPHGVWSGKTYSDSFFPNLTFDINGNLYPINRAIMPKGWQNNKYITSAKKRLLKTGYANQDDAIYFGMRILEDYPKVAKAIIRRFPSFILDEAQDTSEIQMKIIDLLIENGLENIMLVGDPDQAIFEWHNAKPQLLMAKYRDWKNNSIILNENRRSSQNICNCTYRLSTLENTSTATNEDVKGCSIIPVITTYDVNKIDELLAGFRSLCLDFDIKITPDEVGVLYRSKNLFNAISGIAEISYSNLPWTADNPYTEDFAKGKYLFSNGDIRKGISLIQNAIIKALSSSHYCSSIDLDRAIERNGFAEIRKNVYSILKILPHTECSIGEWVDRANAIFRKNKIDIELKVKNPQRGFSFDELFGACNKRISETDYKIGTIHSIKGETFEAVLIILKQKGIGKYYKTLLKEGVPISENEELRIVYVGITRPRRLLVLAVPDEENKAAWETRLIDKSKE